MAERVTTTITVERDETVEEVELPANLAVVDSFDGNDEHENFQEAEFIEVDPADLGAAMKQFNPTLKKGTYSLVFHSLEALTPAGIIDQVDEFQALKRELEYLARAEAILDEAKDSKYVDLVKSRAT